MNRIITYLTAGLLFCSVFSTAQTVTFAMENQTVNAGQSFCIPVRVTNFNQVGGFQFTISYNPSVLKLQATTDNPTTIRNINLPDMQAPPAQTSFGVPKSALPQNVNSNVPEGRITVLWTDNTFTGVSRPNGTTIFEVCFTALQNSGATSTQVTFSNTPLNSEVFNPSFAPLTFNGQPATITINGATGSDLTGFRLSISDRTVDQGQQVCLDVTAEGFQDILLMDFTLQFDATRLQFAALRNFNLAGLSEQNFGLPGQGGVPVNRVTCSWNEPTTAGLSIPNGTVIFQICFNAIGSGTTTVAFGDMPLAIDVRRSNGQEVAFNSKPGTVTINGSGGGGGGTSDTFRLLVEDKTAAPNTEVCVNVSVEGFRDIISWQFHLRYDPTRLQFLRVGNYNPLLPGLNDESITTPGEGIVQPGRIVCGWDSSNGLGVTLPDGTTMFQICFRVVATSGSASITFSDDQLPFEARRSNGMIVPFLFKNGTITISTSGGGGGSGTFRLAVADTTVTNGRQFCLNVTADNMTNILGISGSFSYDPARLQFVEVRGINLPASIVFGTPTSPQQPTAQGVISFVWFDETLASITRPNGTVLFQLCFNAVGANGTTTTVSITNRPTDIVVSDKDERTISFNLKSGTVTIGQAGVSLGQPTITDVTCFGLSTGAITLQVQGGSGNFRYNWSNGATSQNLTNIPAGTYTVTVTDNNTSQTTTATYTVNQPSAALAIVPVVRNVDCAGTNTGSITLTVNGGTTPYRYAWSGSLPAVSAQNNLPAGQYSVTVTDARGCTVSSNLEVGAPAPLVLTPRVTSATAGSSNGSINLEVSGGNTPYRYAWSNNATTANITNLAPGEYCVTVTDNRNCTANRCFTVTELAAPLGVTGLQTGGVTCAGGSDGTISFRIQGGRPPYTVNFGDGTTVQSTDGVISRNNMRGGNFNLSITDSANTTIGSTITISEPSAMAITNVQVVHDSEEPGCTGRISITITGGTPDYLVQWNAPNTGTGTQIINLCEGTFVATVRDSKGCIQSFPGVTVNTFRVNAQITNANCPQDRNGRVRLNLAGGTMPYSVTWRNANGEVLSNTDSLVGVAPGVYTARITEQSGNVLVRQYTVGTVSRLTATIEVISDYNGSQIRCPDSTDGIIEATGASGEGAYTYTWRKDGVALTNTGPVLNNAGAGRYEVIVTDGLGCTVTREIQVLPPPRIELTANIREVSCPGNRDGEIIVSAVGGVMNRPYTFAWGNSATGPRLSFLAPGTYTVTATDANNCRVSTSFTLAEPKPVQVQVRTEPATDGCNGKATALVEGGAAPYTFQWNSFPNQNQQTINNLCPGVYVVRVTDSRGCTSSETARGIVADDRYPCIETNAVLTVNSDGGDGLNDQFVINCIEQLQSNRLEVYNRWGQLVFQANNYDNSWRGTTQSGDLLPAGPYYYVIEFTDTDGKLVQRKGSLTILRDN